jgi:ABC-type dipeptide/oligopeptide/nickel transport system permease component
MKLGKLLERLLQLVPVLLGVSVIVFVMMALTPGDPVQIMIGDQKVTPNRKNSDAPRHGPRPPPRALLVKFLGNAVTGDFGRASTTAARSDVIAERLPATIELTLVALLIALAVTAIPLGCWRRSRRTPSSTAWRRSGRCLGCRCPASGSASCC